MNFIRSFEMAGGLLALMFWIGVAMTVTVGQPSQAKDLAATVDPKGRGDGYSMVGSPCSKYIEGVPPRRAKNITFTSKIPKPISFRTPRKWRSGKYVCVWNFKLVPGKSVDDDSGDESAIEIYFRKLFIGSRHTDNYDSLCRDKLTITHPPSGEIYTRGDKIGCGHNNRVFRSRWDNVQIKLEIFVNNSAMNENSRFSALVSSIPRPRSLKRFKLEDVISDSFHTSPVKGFDFTWQEGRDFCRSFSAGFDLCVHFDVCDGDDYTPFSHLGANNSLQTFPATNGLNYWVYVERETSKCYSDYGYNGPPKWGTDKNLCPENGCESKSYIYCCYYEEPKIIPDEAIPSDVLVSTKLTDSGQFVYRFSEPVDYHDEHHDFSDFEEQSWNSVGRIEGDISTFQLFKYYTKKLPTTIFFCQNEAGKRFKISLKHCKSGWYTAFLMFSTTSPHQGLTPLYVGFSSDELGSRVSLTPLCCGFNRSDDSFVIYGIFKKEWKAEVPSQSCDEKYEYSGPSGTITSPFYPESYIQFMTCSWIIRVQPSHGILVEFNSVFFVDHSPYEGQCRGSYLQFSNSESNRIYGRICGKKTPGTFLSDSNVLEVKFVSEHSPSGNFSFSYTEVEYQAASPVKFDLHSENVSWKAANNVCKSNGKQLCKKQDLCPFSTHIFGGPFHESRWIAVGDEYNDWIQAKNLIGYHFQINQCESHISLYGPPTWGDKKNGSCNSLATYAYRRTSYCAFKRDQAYCCGSSVQETPTLMPVRVNIGYHGGYGGGNVYWFSKSDFWSAPFYDVTDYEEYDNYHYYHTDYPEPIKKRFYPWKPPGSQPNVSESVVDFITLSGEYQEYHFDQIIYFCAQEMNLGLYQEHGRRYTLRLDGCVHGEYSWNSYEFHLYAGKKKTKHAAVELHIGKTNTTSGHVCCEENPQSFTVYVIDAGTEDSYEGLHPDFEAGYLETD